ncbi:unnamed protein product [Blepharisma stoltei]|uniref:Peptidase S59 domain-containing protein n=1 Tax=Blepharisma stoltei TaxID=1481888 RepID=A0AAU9IEH8_9CILI|nr:unnamed protein product [Blepharisma stoltei]
MNMQSQPGLFRQPAQMGMQGFGSNFSSSFQPTSQPFASNFNAPPQGGFGVPSAMPASVPTTSFMTPGFSQGTFGANPVQQPTQFSQSSVPGFGNQQSFGMQTAPTFPNNTMGFSQPMTSPMGTFQTGYQQMPMGNMMNQGKGSLMSKYRPTAIRDDAGANINVAHITAIQEYQSKTTEELRFEDYKCNDGHKRNTQAGMTSMMGQPTPSFSGQTGLFGATSTPMQNNAALPNFGGNNQQNQWKPPTTTLFGNNTMMPNQQTPGQSTLFRPTTAPNTLAAPASGTSLFGGGGNPFGQPQAQPPQQSSSLFPQSNSLFSQNPQQGQQSLFNPATNIMNPNNQSPNRSLFGNNSLTPGQPAFNQQPAQPGSLFGGATSQPQTSLFSATPQQSNLGATQPNSLFGGATSNSLFGGASTSQLGGTLFNNSQQPGSQPSFFSQPQQAQSSLFGGSQPMGGGSLFANTQKPGYFGAPTQPGMFGQSQIPPQMETILTASKDPHGLSLLFPGKSPDSLLDEYKKNMASIQQQPEHKSIINRASSTPKINYDLGNDNWRQNLEKKSYTPSKKSEPFGLLSIPSKERFIITKRPSFEGVKLEEYHDEDNTKYFKVVSPTPSTVRHVNTTEILVVAYNPFPIRMTIPVASKTSIKEIRYQVSKHLEGIEESRIQLVFKSKILQDSDTVKSLSMVHHDVIDVIVTQDPQDSKQKLAPAEQLPKLTKNNYSTKPSIIELARMTSDELKRIKNFTVENEYGKIVFEGETSVIGLDLDKLVDIKQSEVTVYPDDSDENKPKIGEGLNKPATVYLFNCMTKKEVPDNIFVQKLKKLGERDGSEFVSWDSNSKIWVFKVKHF